ncbi:MAG TPA: hypothetical protein VEK57_24005, partial [Thermoanaerobaculia bacterium]|nr:hypothetical protein [Thermoanaerobaculia bacterium]
MSSSLIDIAYNWLGSGPGVPKFALPLGWAPTRVHRFGDPAGAILQDSLRLTFSDPDEFHAPVNGLLRRAPDEATGWPVLKLIDGAPLVPDLHDLLLEVWPSAFRRLEYVFSSLEVPTGLGMEVPQAPAPRWFWFRGVGEGIVTPAQTIANAQFAGSGLSIDIANFLDGRAPLFVAAGDLLTSFDPADPDGTDELEIRAFDANGMILDPDYVFATFQRLADDSDFQRLCVKWRESPAMEAWNPPRRHVLLFTDGAGAPFVSRPDPDALVGPTDPAPDPPEQVLSAGAHQIPIPAHGMVILNDGTPAYADLEGAAFVELALQGEHQRLTLLPHGTLDRTTKASFSPYSFFRLQVVDFARWFPRNPNPLNETLGSDALQRYTDGNEVVPLIDGRNAFRAWYRAIRATYKVESYASDNDVPALDPAATIGEPEPERKALAKILVNHAWLEPDCAFLGRRVMLAAPRVQPGVDPEKDLPDAGAILSRLKVIGHRLPGVVESLDPDEPRRLWWLLYAPDPVLDPGAPQLPPGAYFEVRQLTFLEDFRGDDPRLPGDLLTSDLYGVLAPMGDNAATGWGFVSTDGRLLLPVLLGDDETPAAKMRAVVWTGIGEEPDRIHWTGAVKGQRRLRAYGEVTLPLPEAPPLAVPVFERAGVSADPRMHLEFEGVTGRAVV